MTPALAALPLVTRPIVIGGSRFSVTAAEDQTALLAATRERTLLPFGLMLWESAVALAHALEEGQQVLPDSRVLELGAGVGLPGLVAGQHGARVLQTDIDPLALELCRLNASAHGVSSHASTAALDWHATYRGPRFDLIIGADILYDRADHTALVALFEAAAMPSGRLLLSDPTRPDTALILGRLRMAGWIIKTDVVTVPELANPSRHVGVTLIDARRV